MIFFVICTDQQAMIVTDAKESPDDKLHLRRAFILNLQDPLLAVTWVYTKQTQIPARQLVEARQTKILESNLVKRVSLIVCRTVHLAYVVIHG